ncbi:MAG TPA: hypothetical protein VKT81_07495 [Bryobacteraceae bacterium]|nr:hypothetical protein [Bryobacteraceae bacterium]
MKRFTKISLTCLSFILLAWVFAQTPPGSPPDLARLVPAGPLLYIEAKDFGSLLSDWNASDEKRLWLASDNFQVFSRSRLYLKLQQAQTEFAAAAGVPPDLDLLSNVAGQQSALAIYDIGKLEFLYITRLSSERFAGGALWKTRGNYQPRQSSGIDYYVKTDPASKRVAAFAAAKDYVVLATREDVLAGALALIAGQTGAAVGAEQWFDKSVHQAKSPGELRMVMDLEKLTQSPHFRSYWVQQNITDLRQYSAAIADAGRASGDLQETRVLLRGAEIPLDWNEAAVGEIQRLAPANAGVYRAWASPTPGKAFELLRRKILQPRPETPIASMNAPVVALDSGAVGDESELETRIDEPPLETGTRETGAELRGLLEKVQLNAMLEIGSTRVQPDDVFVGIDSGVVLLAASDWDSSAVQNAVAADFGSLLSIGNSNFQLDGLQPVALAVRGHVLAIATSKELLQSMLAGLSSPSAAPGARYAAVYRHSIELPNFIKMTRLIDHPLTRQTSGDTAEPAYFSGNLASLGHTLGRFGSESISVHDTGAIVTQNVVYKLK